MVCEHKFASTLWCDDQDRYLNDKMDSELSKTNQAKENVQHEINKEIQKLKYYVESVEETVSEGDFNEMKITRDRTTAIVDKINTLVANFQELKIEHGDTARNIRQWKKRNQGKVHAAGGKNGRAFGSV